MLRGCAAFAVLISHWRYFLFLDWPQLTYKPLWLKLLYFFSGFGHQAVVIFFVMSGYLIGGIVLTRFRENDWSWKRYSFDRLTRLGVVLLPALLLCLLWDEIGIHLFHGGWLYSGNSQLAEMTAVNHSLPTFLGNCAFLQTVLVPRFGSNFPLWSLASEFWYYAMFPLVVLGGEKYGVAGRIACLVLLIGIAYMTRHQILAGFAVWLMGTSVFYFPPKQRIGVRVTILFVSMTSIAILGLLAMHRAGHVQRHLSDLILGVLFSIALYFLVHGTTIVGDRYQRVAKFIAGSSYTLYLLHFPLLVCILAAMGRRWQPDAPHLAFGVGLLALIYLYALVVARLFESKTDNIKQWLRPRLGF
jgi:peptidoglycan/LPS O-acetylase OafA/YrhL